MADDSDSAQVTMTGNWIRKTSGGYGPSWLLAKPLGDKESVQFKPHIAVTGKYALYAYVPVVDSAAAQTHYAVSNGLFTKDVVVHSNIQAEGQTSGEWIALGEYNLQKGNNTIIAIDAKNVNGCIVADAILCVPVRAELSR